MLSKNNYALFDKLCTILLENHEQLIGTASCAAHLLRVLHSTPHELLDARYSLLQSLSTEYDVLSARIYLLEFRGLESEAHHLLIDVGNFEHFWGILRLNTF